MRKMTILSLLALASLALFSVGCSKDKNTAPNETQETHKKSITFTIATPSGDPLTLKATTIHDMPEWTVKSLVMYRFNADGSKLIDSSEIDMTKLQQTAEAEYTYTKEFENTEAGTYRFIFVANDKIADVATDISLADFEKKLMTKKLEEGGTSADLLTEIEGEKYIPMSGVAVLGGSKKIALSGTTEPVKVELTRVVARVDVINHIPNLVITGIALRNTNNQTAVFPTQDSNHNLTYVAPAGTQKVAMSKGYTEIPAGGLVGVATPEGAKLSKAIYLYEGTQPAEEKDATAIVVTGKLGSTRDVKYIIPFKESSKGYSPITVKRNHLYTLRLGDNSPITPDTNVKFTIEDTPWNAVTLNHELQFIRVKYNDLDREYTKYYAQDQHLKTNNHGGSHYTFTLSTIYKEHQEFKVEVETNPEMDKLSCELIGDQLTLKVKQLDKTTQKAFTATFKIWSTANPAHITKLAFTYDPDFINPNPAH